MHYETPENTVNSGMSPIRLHTVYMDNVPLTAEQIAEAIKRLRPGERAKLIALLLAEPS